MLNLLERMRRALILAVTSMGVIALVVGCGNGTPDAAEHPVSAETVAPVGVSQTSSVPTAAPVPPTATAPSASTPRPANTPATERAETPVPSETAAPVATASDMPNPTTASQPAAMASSAGIAPDPDYERAMNAASLNERGWDTDFRLHTVPYSEIRFVIPRDNIPSIDSPKFLTPKDASAWLKDVEPVVSLEINGDARAYPLQILTWHEIVNDVIGDVPVAVTFCPLCNSAIAFDRRLDGDALDFGVSGNLRNSDLIMYDRQTHSWWQQFTGEGIVGKHAGRALEHLSASVVSFADFKSAFPEGQVLSRETGYARQYGRNPYAGYDTFDGNPFLFTGDLDGRLLPVERVIAVTVEDVDLAFPLKVLQEEGVINYSVEDRQIAVFHKFGTTSALDASSIADSRDVGSAGVFDAVLDEQALTFRVRGEAIVDDQTGSAWNILGNAIEGPLAGKSLTPVVHGNHFWFAWAVFKPDTILYQGEDGA